MCKIIAFTNVSKIKSVRKLTLAARDLVCATELDGFGYAVQGSHGVYGERSIDPLDFQVSANLAPLDAPFVRKTQDTFGKHGKAIGGALFHGRTSTNKPGLLNTHPIQKHGWTLIHNGVVSNHGRDYEAITENDTEHLVEYMANEGINGVTANLTGYYAFAAFDPDGRIHVVRDSIAPLFTAFVKSADTFVIATRAEHITSICKTLNLKHSMILPVQDNVHIIFDNGAPVMTSAIIPRGRTNWETRYASKSLGRELDDSDTSIAAAVKSQGWRESADWSGPAVLTSWRDDVPAIEPDSEELFLQEMELDADDSYTIMDYKRERISHAEFLRLDDDEKLACTVVRPDGTVCDPADYGTVRLYEGAS